MADTQAPAPAQAPAQAPAPKAAEAPRAPVRAGVITNPAPVVDPDAPVADPKIDTSMLPQSTLDEMEAGRRALNRNRPVAAAVEARVTAEGKLAPAIAVTPKA